MGYVVDFSLFVASTDELRTAGPGWKASLAEPVRVHVLNPFTQAPVEILSTNPIEPFEAGTPTRLDLSKVTVAPLERFDNGDIERLSNLLLGSRLLSASDAEAARAFDVPLFGPVDPETDGVYRVLPGLVDCFARMSTRDLETVTELWVERRKGGWPERSPNARVEQDWEDQVRTFAEMSRRAVLEKRDVFLRLAFKPGEPLRRASRAVYRFPRHDFHRLFLRVTPTSHDAIVRARKLPPHRRGRDIAIDHLLVALLDDAESDFALLFDRHGFEPAAVRAVFAEEFDTTVHDAPLPPFGMILQLLVDTHESQAFSSRLVRIRSLDLLFEILSDPGRYGLDWIKKRLGTLASRTKFRFVRVGEHGKEAHESRVGALV
jgi:Clp amino terminal domain, pathogenicity island component